MVKLLLDNKANPNSKISFAYNSTSSSCLLYATANNQFETAQMLADAGATDSYMKGRWRVQYRLRQTMDNTGKVSDSSSYHSKDLNLTQNKSVITGSIAEADSDSCVDAKINGKIVDNNVDWTLEYTGD